MSEFEFISVLISIVAGLAIAQLLRGVAQAVHERTQAAIDSVHMVWTAAVFLNLVLNWWVLFSWRDHGVWSFTLFLSLIVWAVALYLPVAATAGCHRRNRLQRIVHGVRPRPASRPLSRGVSA